MLDGFQKIVEERIRQAQKKGDFDNLPGFGKPLKFEDENIPEDLRMAYKILKNANCVPPEIEIKKEILQAEDLLANMPDTAEKYRLLKKINFLVMKFNAARNGKIDFELPQHYQAGLVERLEASRAGKHRQEK
jgi:hypothetical protein